MTKFYLYLSRYLTVLFLLGVFLTQAQNRTVGGKVTSADDGTALPGVNVVQKGTNNGTATDADGRFTISVPEKLFWYFLLWALQARKLMSEANLLLMYQWHQILPHFQKWW
jgi:hypothetical protein